MKTLQISIDIEEKDYDSLQKELDDYFGGVPLEQWIEQTILTSIENGSLLNH